MKIGDLYDLLTELYFVRILSSTRLGKYLEVSTTVVKKMFKKMLSAGLVLKPDVAISRMGLRPVIIIVGRSASRIKQEKALRIPYLKSVWLSPGKGVIFVLFLPTELKIVVDEDINVKIFYYHYKLRSRPSVALVKSLPKSLPDVAKTIPSEPVPRIENMLSKRARFDSLDLKILEVVRDEPWVSMRELASRLKVRRGYRVEYHIVHAEELISGYGVVRIGSLYREYGSMRFLFYRCSDASTFARTMLTHPFVIAAVWSRSDAFLQVYYPAKYGVLFNFMLSDVVRSHGCEEIDSLEVVNNPSLSLVTSFPADASEYSKVLRSWKPVTIKLSHLLQCIEWERR